MLTIKKTQIISGIALLSIGLFILFFLLSINLLQNFSIFLEHNIITWIFVTIIPLVFIEGGVFWIKQSIKISEENIEKSDPEMSGIIPKVASKIAIVDRYCAIVACTTLIFFIFYITYSIYFKDIDFTLAPNNIFYAQIIFIALYFLIVRRIFINSGINLKKYYPQYSVRSESVLLNLNIKNLSHPNMKYQVELNFNELDEIKELSYIEAQSLLNYRIGPNLTLKIAAVKDLYNYAKDKTQKMHYFVYFRGSNVKTLALKGKQIFYLISVNKTNCSDLILAFENYKKHKIENISSH